MKAFKWMVIATGLALASPAAALTDYSISGRVTKVAVTDNVNHGGTGKQLDIDFDTSGNVCNSTATTHAAIGSTESTNFDHWVRQAEAAYLSGRTLHVVTTRLNPPSGPCNTWYVELL